MNVLITGANGFIGKNLISALSTRPDISIIPIYRFTSDDELDVGIAKADWIVHLAGSMRPKNTSDFKKTNQDYTKKLMKIMNKVGHFPSFIFASSIQIDKHNLYGKSKLLAEETIDQYSLDFGFKFYNYRLTNVFGKWCKPNYNSVVANFCYNIANNLPIRIDNEEAVIRLSYIDDVVDAFILNILNESKQSIQEFETNIGELARRINLLSRLSQSIDYIELDDPFNRRLLSTYITYLPESKLLVEPITHKNELGSFTEFGKNSYSGQFSLNISRPGAIRGNHWHRSKHEKFLVVSGEAIVRMRRKLESDVKVIMLSQNELTFLDIPAGFVHHIENIGDKDLIFIIWANEIFDQANPDTYPEEV